jgi:hypothetical protein
VRALSVATEVHRQREATTALVTLQRPVGDGDARDAHALFRLVISEEAKNRSGLGFRDPAAADAGQARVLAFLPSEFFGELHS